MKITIIGCGGVGTHLALPLLKYAETWFHNKYGNYHNNKLIFTLVDGDNFEEKNLERQLINPSGLGVNKARWLGGFCNLFAKRTTEIKIVEEYITDENIKDILDGYVFSCVDNNATRKLIEEYRKNRHDNNYDTRFLNIISGGNEVYDGNVYISNNQKISISEIHKEINDPQDVNPGESCTQLADTTPQISVANNMVASLMLVQFYKMTDRDIVDDDKTELYFDIRSGEVVGFDRRKRNGN